MFEKVIINNKVAVCYSPGYGAGWSTWNDEYKEELCMRKEIVEFVMEKDFDGLTVFMEENYPDVYLGGMRDLCIRMVPVGSFFKINEYDGNESVELGFTEFIKA
jgi:hypothetical protein